ncbi:MAG: dTDP-glucose 4,6-dehydratase [Desulfobacteraceae bacterium]|nr:dTDP-glucose 4,6-dehydratase [Desulfobacteraceae bacterium]
MKTWLVAGGAGFIGSNFILAQRARADVRIVNLDFLTYAGNLANLQSLKDDPDHVFVQGNMGDRELLRALLAEHRPRAVVNFAAQTHVDRSIADPEGFIQTNVVDTFRLLEEVRRYWENLPEKDRAGFRFLQVSTDEVYGSLGPADPPFHEKTPYAPNSPYSAAKAAGDHLVRAYHHTYGLPTLTTNCSNNYGPRQFPEKFIPLLILNGLRGKPLPIYGDGKNVRDWLFVEDHCEALRTVLTQGRVGEVYNIGGKCEKTNLEIVNTICSILDEHFPDSPFLPHSELITFVADRAGHDRRYAMDTQKIETCFGWQPRETFHSGIRRTVQWYLDNPDWIETVETGAYRESLLDLAR